MSDASRLFTDDGPINLDDPLPLGVVGQMIADGWTPPAPESTPEWREACKRAHTWAVENQANAHRALVEAVKWHAKATAHEERMAAQLASCVEVTP